MNTADQAEILLNSALKLDLYCNGSYDQKYIQTDIIRLFQLYLSIYTRLLECDDLIPAHTKLWNGLWASFTKAIERYYAKDGWEFDKTRVADYWRLNTSDPTSKELFEVDKTLAHELVVTICSNPAVLAEWNDEDGSQIPPALVEALWLFVPTEERTLLCERFQGLPPPDAPPEVPRPKRAKQEQKKAGEAAKRTEDAKNSGDGTVVQKKGGSSTKGEGGH